MKKDFMRKIGKGIVSSALVLLLAACWGEKKQVVSQLMQKRQVMM